MRYAILVLILAVTASTADARHCCRLFKHRKHRHHGHHGCYTGDCGKPAPPIQKEPPADYPPAPEVPGPEQKTPEQKTPQQKEPGKDLCCADASCRLCVEECGAIRIVNRIRSRHGLRPVKRDRRIIVECRRHSRRMATGYGHNHARNLESSRMENIAWGYRDLDQAINSGWMHSSGHRSAILSGSATHIGVARDGQYHTMRLR